MTDLPVIGAALMIDDLEPNLTFLRDMGRDIELQDFTKVAVLEGDWQSLADKARDLLSGHVGRIGIHGPFWGLSIASRDPDVRKVVNKRMHQGLDACERIGATHMVIHSPFTTWDYNNAPAYPDYENIITSLTHETLDDVVKRAESIGLTLVIENIEDKDPHTRVRLAKSFESQAVAVSLDTGHALYAQGSTGAPPVDYHVHAAGDLLGHVHLQDADGYADRHWQVGKGAVNWHALFDAISRYSGKPRLILEPRDVTTLGASVAWLNTQGLGQ